MEKTFLHIPPDSSRPGLEYVTSTFPSGEAYVKLTEPGELRKDVDIHYRWTGDSSLMILLNLVNALRLKKVTGLRLFCPYFPGCRSDRVGKKNEGEALSSKVYADIINTANFDEVVVFDPHSDVVPAVLNNRTVVTNHEFVKHVFRQINEDLIVISPDAGANKKVFELVEFLGNKNLVVRADKKRDVETGKLVPGECTVFATMDELKGKACVIVDDICSRGGTFIALANALRNLGVTNIYLVVSHYEGCADPAKLKAAGITQVYATTSLHTSTDPYINTTDIKIFL